MFLIGALAIVATIGPATTYEISIYAAYPPLFWILLILSWFSAIAILLLHAFHEDHSKLWSAGLTLVIVDGVIFFLLPLIRGYHFFDDYDSLTTITYIQDMQITGHLVQNDFYPISHLFLFSLVKLGNISMFQAGLIVPAIDNVLYVSGILLFTISLGFKHRQQLIAIALAAPPFFVVEQYTATPRGMAFAFLPYVLYLFVKSRGGQFCWSMLFVAVLLVMVPLHPLNGGLLLIAVFSVIFLTLHFYYRLLKRKNTYPPNNSINFINRNWDWIIVVLLLVTWFAWYTNFDFLKNFVQYLATVSEWLPSQASYYLSTIATRQLSIGATILILLKLHVHNFLYLGVAAIGSIHLFREFFLKRSTTSIYTLALPSLLVFFNVITVAAAFLPFDFEYYRLVPYAIMPAVVIDAWFLGHEYRRKLRVLAVVFTLVFVGLVVGIFNTYPSPWIQGANAYVTTQTSAEGSVWFIDKQDGTTPIVGIPFVPYQALVWVTGYEDLAPNIQPTETLNIPPDFGYDKYTTVGALYNGDVYWLLDSSAYDYYSKRIPDNPSGWLWTVNDLNRLFNDPALSLVYNNGSFDVFVLKGSAKFQ
jgi:hypothetical protein